MAADKLAALQPVQHAMQAVSFVVLEVNSCPVGDQFPP